MLSLKLPLILIVVYVVLVRTEDETNPAAAASNETSFNLPNPETQQPKEPCTYDSSSTFARPGNPNNIFFLQATTRNPKAPSYRAV